MEWRKPAKKGEAGVLFFLFLIVFLLIEENAPWRQLVKQRPRDNAELHRERKRDQEPGKN